MNDWTKDLWTFCADIVTDIEEVVQEITTAATTLSQDLEESRPEDWTNWVNTLWAELTEPEEWSAWLTEEEAIAPFPSLSWVAPPPTCQGCQHYHGHVYNKNLLVCAMHPYGKGDTPCPDWESAQP